MEYITDKQMLALVKLSLDYNTQITAIAIQVLNTKTRLKDKELQKEIIRISKDFNERTQNIMEGTE